MTDMPSPAHSDVAARRSLNRHRAFAALLLVLMAAITLASFSLPHGPWRDWLQASAKAGFVGGIADWFAVTALFRHPLGLPIPHTAIIPLQKARLGRALGRFVAGNVFTEAEIGRLLMRLDLAGIVRDFLTDANATQPAAEGLAALLPRLLASIEDGRARRVAARLIPRILGGEAAGRVVGRALRGLMEGGRHQEVFSFILTELRQMLGEREETLRGAIEERVREQGGRLVGWAVGATVAKRAMSMIHAELIKMETQGSDMRDAFDEWVRREVNRIEEEPQRAAEIGQALRRVLTHDTIQAWIGDVWSRLRMAIEVDAARPNGRTVAIFQGALANFGTMLNEDDAARARLQRAVQGVLTPLMPGARGHLESFIADVVGSWDTDTLVDRLELRIGADLQYVRINGTLVGFLVGGLVWAGLRAVFGDVRF
ncbi:MAG: DUF445 domain-containing protein [Acetobacteraceae bacterium]|nr:DUF445 domain-containing protein [Acetobacteraceae bacterium]